MYLDTLMNQWIEKKHMQQDVLFMFSEIEVYDSVCIQ